MADIKDLNSYTFPNGQKLIDLEREKYDLHFTKGHSSINIVKGYTTEEEGRILEESFKKVEQDYENFKKTSTQDNKEKLFKSYIDYDVYTRFIVANHIKPNYAEIIKNQTGEYIYDKNVINYPEGYDDWLKKKNQELEKQIQQQNLKEQEREEKLITEIAVFEYEGLTYIPVRAFTDNEKNLVNNRNAKQIWNGAIIEKPKNGEQYSLEDFKTKSKTKDTDIFYCVERAKFFTPIENGIINLNVDSLNNHFDDDLNKFKNTSIVQDIIKNHRPLVFDKEKDTKLMTNIISVITESDVFLEKNETLGEVRIKFGSFKSGGVNHIIQRRMDKMVKHEGIDIETAQKETTAILFMSLKNVSEAPATKETSGRYAIYKNGIKTIVGTDKNGRYVVTGFDFDDTKSEAAEAIRAVNAQYGYTPEFLEIYAQVGAAYASMNNIAQLNSVVNENKTLKQKLENADKTIQEQNKELDIWTSKANADDKTIENLNKQLEQEKAYHTSSCVITVPQRDSNGNEIIGKDGKPLTAKLNCTEGVDAALGKLSKKCVDLTLENQRLQEELDRVNNRNSNSQSDNSSWSD